MNRATIVFLVLLRLAIGWHFLFEGLQKVRSTAVGPTATSRPFSSAGYFREAPGPAGTLYRWGLGDPDDEALGRLTVQPIPPDEDSTSYKPRLRTPPLLRKQWHDYVDRFIRHYGLDERQRKAAEGKLAQAEDSVVAWLTDPRSTREVTKKYPSGEFKRQETLPERIADYRARVEEVRDLQKSKLPAFGKDVEGARLRLVKAEAARMRADLLKDLGTQTAALEKALEDIPNADQKERGPVGPDGVSNAQRYLDWLTCWGLTAIGACLLAGLFTRLNCVLAAGFLLVTYLAIPALPWLPAPLQSEGNYLFVNKNVVEMLALCVLATTASGRWFGLDAILYGIWSALRGKKGDTPPQPAKAGVS
jgi:uncharacterized membrane protein YphA (DoxX/SURF4 family)